MSPDNHTQKDARRQASLELKLTFLEAGRRLWLLVSTDILVSILFFGGLFVWCEQTAAAVAGEASAADYSSAGFRVYETDGSLPGYKLFETDGYEFFKSWSRGLPDHAVLKATLRRVVVPENVSGGSLTSLRGLRYVVAIPKDETAGSYTAVDFTLEKPVSIFGYAFAVLLFFEIIGLIGSVHRIRRSIRRALRPIYDLTLAAQSMNKTASPILQLPGAQELHLSGAIDTLNNITENDLGSRIVISDEREELRGLAQAINAMLDRLDAAYRSQLRFVSDASHELRTPIAVIQGYANLLDRWGKNDQVTLQESIDAIKAEASGMQDLVEQLLFLARSDNQSIVLNIENVDTYALVDEVLRETQMIDPSHEFSAKLTESVFVRGDAQLLKQALRIFVDNAIKYTPSGGKIKLSARGGDGYAKIAVTDNGIGIPEGDLSRVFDRFFRSDESRTRETGGTGHGLSIAKWIIDRHGGYVEIVSREDAGTKVTVCLPQLKNALEI